MNLNKAEPVWDRRILSAIVCACLLLASPVLAEPPEQEELTSEFLEFLGEFETEGGEWIDPDDVPDTDSKENTTDENNNENTN